MWVRRITGEDIMERILTRVPAPRASART
jgi:hypothetical protein